MSLKKVHLATFGCQMNVDDSERLAAQLAGRGYRPWAEPDTADLVVINTCSVRAKAEEKVYSLLGRLGKLKAANPALKIVLTGCLAQQEGRRLLARFPQLDLVAGTGAIHRLPELLERPGRGVDVDLKLELPVFTPAPAPESEGPVKTQVTIMQGCDNFCAYCVVPHLRGRERSRPAGEILEETAAKAAAGAREVNLLGQNVNSYGHEGWDFVRLLKSVCALPGLNRVRFTTSHPKDMSPELIACLGAEKRLAPFLHLPFQSGSDRVLKRMNRGYTREDYLGLIKALKAARPELALSADCIVGFPGETEEDFAATLDLLERVRFDALFSFRYSDRPGTAASRFPDKVPPAEAARRLIELQARQRQITLESNQALEGREVEVLVEGPDKKGGLISGRTGTNKIVNFPGEPGLKGRLVRVRVVKAGTNSLRGRLIGG